MGSPASASFTSAGPADRGTTAGDFSPWRASAQAAPGVPARASREVNPSPPSPAANAASSAFSPPKRCVQPPTSRKSASSPAGMTRGVKPSAHRASRLRAWASAAESASWTITSGTMARPSARGMPGANPALTAAGLTASITSRPRCSPTVTNGRVRASGKRQASLSTGHQGNQATRMRRGVEETPMSLGPDQPARRERSRGSTPPEALAARPAASAEAAGSANGRTRHRSSSHPTVQHPGLPPRQCCTSTRHLASPSPGTVVARHRLSAMGTLIRPVRPRSASGHSTSPGTPEPSAASIKRREVVRSRESASATTPLRARQRSASSMAHSMSAWRRNLETTSNRPGSIP